MANTPIPVSISFLQKAKDVMLWLIFQTLFLLSLELLSSLSVSLLSTISRSEHKIPSEVSTGKKQKGIIMVQNVNPSVIKF